MAKKNADLFKKHHYWGVALGALVLSLLTFVFVMSDVSGAVEKKDGEIKSAKSKVSQAKAPGQIAINAIDEQKKILDGEKDKLWKANWDAQAKFYTWPKTPDRMFDAYNALKFGDALKDFDDYKAEFFRRETVYKAAYEELAKSVAPTRFSGAGWGEVLKDRFIAVWGDKKPDSRQMWLAVEDLWVTRAMLEPVKLINDMAQNWTPVEPAAGLLKRGFTNGTWLVTLEVADLAPNKILKAKLKNLTRQMQLLGTASTMNLKVWLDPNKDLPPMEFRIEGEFVPGGDEITVQPLGSHIIPPGVQVSELFRVEQVLDDRTVPVREIKNLKLNYLSSRDWKPGATTPQQPPDFWKEDDPAPGATPGTPGTPAAPAGPPVTGRGEGAGPRTGFPIPGGGAGPAGGTGGLGTTTLMQATNDNRKRYLEVTGQLRRMPVAVQVVMDYRYMQDLLVAYANSPLRLEIKQYHWSRYRGALASETATPGTPGSPGALPGSFGGPGDTNPAISGRLGEGLRGGRGEGRGEGRGAPPASSDIAGGAPPLPFNPAGALPASPGLPGLPGGVLTSVSDAQANSALIELTIYGVVTLYEKYEDKPAAPGAAATPPAAKETPKDAPKEEPKVTPKEAPKDAPKDAPKETPKEPAKDPAKPTEAAPMPTPAKPGF